MRVRISRNRCRISDLEDLTEGSRQMDADRWMQSGPKEVVLCCYLLRETSPARTQSDGKSSSLLTVVILWNAVPSICGSLSETREERVRRKVNSVRNDPRLSE